MRLRRATGIGQALMVIAVAALAVVAPEASLHAQEQISGPDFVRMVQASLGDGEAIDVAGLAVAGDVDLSALQSIGRPIRCTQCVFGGRFSARDVTFDGIVDFTGSTFVGAVDLRGATFQRVALFDVVRFRGSVGARTARFEDLGSFTNARFFEAADFDQTVFAGRALFSSNDPRTLRPFELQCGSTQPAFIGEASFVGASFQDRVDFRQRCFESEALFTGATFGSTVDFTRASFFRLANFEQASFGDGAQFRITDFGSGASFQGAVSGGDMNFAGSTLRARVNFNGFGGTGALLIEDITAPTGERVLYEMNSISIGSLIMSTDQVERIGGPRVQQEALELIADSAGEDGRLSLANDAQFELLSLQRAEKTGLDRVWWWLGEHVGGYLVRPFKPIVALLLSILAGALVRVGWSWWKRRGTSAGVPVAHLIDDAFSGLASSTAVAARRKPAISKPTGEGGKPARKREYGMALLHFSEWFLYRMLVVVTLIGVARSIPVVRELIDAVF